MYLKKTPNLNGWIRLSIVDTYYDEVLKDIGTDRYRKKTFKIMSCDKTVF